MSHWETLLGLAPKFLSRQREVCYRDIALSPSPA